ncbi:MAG: sensor histidine kinase, partial [Roseimicrobium sp.]
GLFLGNAAQSEDDERRRVANQLHDTLQQTMVAASLHLHAASRLITNRPNAAAEAVGMAQELVDRGRNEVRDAVWDLRVDDKAVVDTGALLQRLCQETSSAGQAEVTFAQEAPCPLPAHLATQVVRIAREALTNALKHAAAKNIKVQLISGQLLIEDDGCGFHPESAPGPETGHFGLSSMRERIAHIGGALELHSSPRGTRICAHLTGTPPTS